AWLAAAMVSTGAALLQYFGLADRFEPWIDASAAGEAFANLRQRNQFASLTTIGMAALLRLGPRDRKRWPAFAAMAWLAVGNTATTSRTGLLEVLLLGALIWRWRGLRSWAMRLWLVGLGAYIAGAIGLPAAAHAMGLAQSPLWMRVTGIDPCGSRLVLWSNVLHLIAQRPWLGWGWGELDYAHYVTLYPGPRFCDILDNAHNLPLHLAVELGVPAAIVVCGAFTWGVWHARPWNERDPARQMAWSVLLVLVVHSLLEYPLWYGPFEIALGLCLGLLWPASDAGGRRASSWPAPASGLVSVVVLCAAAYAMWDYRVASQVYLPQEQRSPAWRDDPLARAKGAWLFRNQVLFAELTLTPLTRNNAEWMFDRASALLHYSPEPRVIEKLIESAVLLRRDREALRQMARFRAAFPQAYADWSAANRSARPR
ncbi:MAG TPA: Wzy polymerase domain-containing protein, partial [Ramlibacter sp.]|nr:Wzy polymerase domain-containing protein [Ramlibacter sp.]